ncbi:bacterial Ig-like domain-containing protein [Mediterraneibacter sp.]
MKVKSMKKAVAMACALGMIVTSGAVPGSMLTAEASTSWTWNANTSESGYSKIPTSELTATADSCAGSSETDRGKQTNGSWNNAVDGNVNTYWHSRYDNSAGSQGTAPGGTANSVTDNNKFTVTLANPESVQGVTYLSRQSELANGYFHQFIVEVQKDGEDNWTTITGYNKVEDGSADSTGLITLTALNNSNFESHKFEKEFIFSETQENVKKIRFTVKAVHGSGAHQNAAEISVLKSRRGVLNTAIAEAEAEAVKMGIYTAESINALEDAIAHARGVSANTEATDEELLAELTTLTAAKDSLVRYTVSGVTVTSTTGITTAAKINSTLQLNATVETDGENADKTVTWTSSNTDVATVNNAGLVTFKSQCGSTTITATSTLDTEKSGTITLNMAAKDAEQESVIVEDGTAAATGDSGTLNPNITWNGNWTIWSGERDSATGLNKYHGNSKVDANANGAYFEYTFTGTGIAYYAQKHSNQGTMNVKIGSADANAEDMEDLGDFSFNDGSANGTPQQEVFSKKDLALGTYKVRFTRTSADKGINFDFLKVYLSTVTVDKTELQNQLEKKAGLNAEDYTSEKWAAYCVAYDTAVAVMNRADATEEDVTAQVAALEKAYTVLTINVDKEALNTAIAEATGLVTQADTYTTASLAELQKALDAAKALAADDTAEQEAVNEAVAALESAKAGLVQIKVTEMTVTAPDKVVYERGDNLDTTGMVVTVTDNNEQTRELTAGEYTVVGFDSDTAGEKTVTVKYGELEKSFTVTVNACYIVTVDGKEYTRGQYNDKVTVTAEEKDGQNFAGWKQNGQVVSSDKTYTFYLAGDVKLESVYDKEINVEPQAILANVTAINADTSGKGKVRFYCQLAVPKGYTVQESGIIWTGKNKATVESVYQYDGTDVTVAEKAHMVAAKTYGSEYHYYITVTGVPKEKTARGVVYAKMTNGTETKWVFSSEGQATVH